jgi:hypothetical protein
MGRWFPALAAMLLLVAVACGDDGSQPASSPGPSAGAPMSALEATPEPLASADPDAELCLRVADIEMRLVSLRAVELRLPNRVALDIELDKLEAAYNELRGFDFGASEDRLAGSLKRLGYRLGELELAVEDFRTNPRPRRAVPHVEEDAQAFADELAAFAILSRC